MKLTVLPDTKTDVSTISKLLVDGVFECWVLEPPNPIPAGTYEIKLQHSEHFGRIMPFLQNVPGHTGIEIHYGNSVKDTKDCFIVGRTKSTDFVGESGLAFSQLFTKLQLSETVITIDVYRQVPSTKPQGVTMADPTPATPTPPTSLYQVQSKVSLPIFAGAFTSAVLGILKARWNIDLSAEASSITVVVMGVVGYLVPNA